MVSDRLQKAMGKKSDHDLLEKKLYQLIISRLDGADIHVPQYREKIFRLVEKGICGFILFGGHKDEVRPFVKALQTASDPPLLIAADVERGVGQQVEGTTIFPCQMAMAAAVDRLGPDDSDTFEKALQAIAREAGHVGINMPLIPVLDVNQDPDNPIICTRAFSDDPEVVAWFGSKYVDILEKFRLVSCAKHFPGHGDTSVDSHISLPVIRKTLEELMDTDIIPFRAAVGHGVSSIMVGHLSVPAIDSAPASLSKSVHRMLRSTLAFGGLILTDALTMSAISDIPDAAARCLNAGADILLHPADVDETVQSLLSAVRSGQLVEDTIDAALNRIISRKQTLCNSFSADADFRAHAEISSRIAGKSVSLIKDALGAPVIKRQNMHIFMAGDEEPALSSLFRALSVNTRMVHQDSDDLDLRNSTTVIAIFAGIAAWKGSSGISRNEIHRIETIIRRSRHSIVVSFGNPYVLRHFPQSDVLIAAYDMTDRVQQKVLNWLMGADALEGKIPVRLF